MIQESLHDEINRKVTGLFPTIGRVLAASWNIFMKILISIGVMPIFRKHPWLLILFIVFLMAIIPTISLFLVAIGCAAIDKNVKAENSFIISPDETSHPNQELVVDREAVQGEAMRRVLDAGHTVEEACIAAKVMGELYDLDQSKKAESKHTEIK